MKQSWAKAVLCLIAAAALLAVPAQAQLTVGSVTGTVMDATGAVIPGATVTLTSEATGVTREQQTDSTGAFNFDRVRPGAYKLRISMSGFKTAETAVEVTVGKVSAVSVSLEVGATTETVEIVAGAVPLMQAESPQIVGAYDSRAVSDVTFGTMGLDSTSFLTAGIVPGFGNINTNTGTGGQFGSGFGTAPAASGQRARSTQFSIDGHESNDISLGGPNVFLDNLDTVSEYQVTVNSFDASQGRLPGAQVNVITKGGTNDFHGTAFYFYETSGLRAKSSTEDRFDNEKGKHVFQRYGGTFGGPIVKNKFFGFGSFLRNREPNSAKFTVSTGNLSFLQPSALALAAAVPNNATLLYANSGPFTRPLGNPRCGTSIFTVSVVGFPVQACGIDRDLDLAFLDWEYSLRFDFVANSKHTFTGKWFHENFDSPFGGFWSTSGYATGVFAPAWSFSFGHTFQVTPRAINDFRFSAARLFVAFEGGNTVPGVFESDGINKIRANLANIDMPSGFQDFGCPTNCPQGRLVYNFQFQDNFSYIFGRHTIKAGMEVRRNRTTVPGFLPFQNGQYRFTTLTQFGTNAPATITFANGPFAYQPFETDQFYYVQDDFRLRPNFILNLGVRYEHTGQPANGIHEETLSRETGVNGQIPFWTSAIPIESRTFPEVKSDDNNWGPRIGFAYTPRIWKSVFGEDKTVIRGGYLIAYEAAFYNILLNISTAAPRVFLFTVCGTSAACGGLGGVQGNGTGAALAAFAQPLAPLGTRDPREFSRTVVPSDFHSPYVQNWSLGIQREFGSNIVAEARYVGSRQIGQYQSINANPRFFTYINGALLVGPAPSAVPTGLIPCGSPGNTAIPPTFVTTASLRRVDCAAGPVRSRINGANANYHGLQTRLDFRNVWNQVTGGVGFTWSKTIDNVSEIFGFFGNGSSAFSENPFRLNDEERGLSNIHLGRVYTTYWIWDSPWFRDQQGAKGKILGGWQWNGQVFLYDGRPWTPVQFFASWLNGLGFAGFFTPYCAEDVPFNNTFAGTFETCRPYLNNPSAPLNTVSFTPTMAAFLSAVFGQTITSDPNAHWWINDGTLGPAGVGRNPRTYGDGLALSNMGFFKNTRLGAEGRYNLQFRVMIQNVFNHRNFGVPDVFVEDTSTACVGQGGWCRQTFITPGNEERDSTFATASKNDAVGRDIRLGLRFIF